MTNEATILSNYLIHASPTAAHSDLYAAATAHRQSSVSLQACLDKPWLLPYIDGYDALFRPQSELRSRLYLMFSILEASPDYLEKFLPRQRSKAYVLMMPLYGLRAGLRAAVGLVLVKVGNY